MKLDTTKPYGSVYGNPLVFYEQGCKKFDSTGHLIGEEEVKPESIGPETLKTVGPWEPPKFIAEIYKSKKREPDPIKSLQAKARWAKRKEQKEKSE